MNHKHKPWIIKDSINLTIMSTPDYEYPYEAYEEWGYTTIEEELETHLQSINQSRLNYVCCVNGFGWRKVNGVKHLYIKCEPEILTAILPVCECHFKIWITPTGFVMQNFHHDNCDGSEWYELRVDDSEESKER